MAKGLVEKLVEWRTSHFVAKHLNIDNNNVEEFDG